MSTPFLVPLQPNNQVFTLTLAGVSYQFRVKWNDANQAWTLDISFANGTAIVTGIPMITGTDLLAPYAYLNFGGQLIVQTTDDLQAVPTLANLGSNGNLYFLPNQ